MRFLPLLAVIFAFACSKPAEQVLTSAVVVEEDAPEQGCAAHAAHEEIAALPSDLKPGDEALCVVMNRKFLVTEATPTTVYEGKTFAFCCDGCKEMFDADPKKYATLAMK